MSAGSRGGAGHSSQGRARREKSAGGVVVRVAEGRPLFLLIQDSYGHWGLPKGHLERGERAATAALREVMEETGLRSLNLIGAIDTIEWRFRLRGVLINKQCEFFLMLTDTEATRPQESEGISACRWVTAVDAMDLILHENARQVLRRANEMLSTRAVGLFAPLPG